MDEPYSFRLFVLLFLLLISFDQQGRLDAELRKKIPERAPALPRSPRSNLPLGSDSSIPKRNEPRFSLHFIGKEMTNVYFWEKCSQDLVESVDDNAMYILTSRPQPDPGSLPPVQYAGRFIEITYNRQLFGLHGGYTCAIVARSSDLPELTEPLCGISKNDPEENSVTLRVVDGEDVNKSAFPWMVLLEFKANGFSYVCGGTLLSGSIVATAAHCLDDGIQEILVGLGKIKLREDDEAGSVWMTTRNFTVHPKFDRRKILNDIGLIFLPSTVSFSDNIRPACLPSATMTEEKLIGYSATALGWGSTKYEGPLSNNLQKINMIIWSNDKCEAAWSEFNIGIQDTEMCALSEGKDTCNGDSGGPLLIKFDGHWTLVGITSYGFECASPGIPGVYTRVTEYVEWIRSYFVYNNTNNSNSATEN